MLIVQISTKKKNQDTEEYLETFEKEKNELEQTIEDLKVELKSQKQEKVEILKQHLEDLEKIDFLTQTNDQQMKILFLIVSYYTNLFHYFQNFLQILILLVDLFF